MLLFKKLMNPVVTNSSKNIVNTKIKNISIKYRWLENNSWQFYYQKSTRIEYLWKRKNKYSKCKIFDPAALNSMSAASEQLTYCGMRTADSNGCRTVGVRHSTDQSAHEKSWKIIRVTKVWYDNVHISPQKFTHIFLIYCFSACVFFFRYFT